jgi:hypothetical protein
MKHGWGQFRMFGEKCFTFDIFAMKAKHVDFLKEFVKLL